MKVALYLLLLAFAFSGCESRSPDEGEQVVQQPVSDVPKNDEQKELERRVQELSEEVARLTERRDQLQAQINEAQGIEYGRGFIWGDVLPKKEPLRLREYDPQRDMRRLRSTYEARAENESGGVRYAGNVEVSSMGRGYNEWALELKDGKRNDYLKFWVGATQYTNYINKVGLTKGEASVFAFRARAEAIKTIPELLEQWKEGESLDPTSSIESYCYTLHLTEEDLGLTKSQILEAIEHGEKKRHADLLVEWRKYLQRYYESKDHRNLGFTQNTDLKGADLGITEEELQRLRALFQEAMTKNKKL
jgi:DNA-binding transcriptional MerR regulator